MPFLPGHGTYLPTLNGGNITGMNPRKCLWYKSRGFDQTWLAPVGDKILLF